MFGHPLHVWVPPYVWMSSCMFGCASYFWMSPILRGSYVPIHLYTHMFGWPPLCLDVSPYVWTSPICLGCHLVCLDALICLDVPVYLHTLMFGCLPVCLYHPLCLGASCMYGHPYMFGCLPYIWMPPVCLGDVWMLPVYTQHKEAYFVRLRGVHIPHTFEFPIHLDVPLYIWMPPYNLMQPLYVWMPPYVWMPHVHLDTPLFGCILYVLEDVWIPTVHTQHK